MPRTQRVSAGLLMCRRGLDGWEFLLAHPGGPFFVRKDDGAWSIPKGLVEEGEALLSAARREFKEETGFDAPEDAHYEPLGEVVQKGGKRVAAWAFVGECDPAALVSNTFELEWPPRSGKRRSFPEIDRVAFFAKDAAHEKVLEAQRTLVLRAERWLARE